MKTDYRPLLADLKANLLKFENEINTTIIEGHNYIIKVGEYTVAVDEENKTFLERTLFPTQFNESGKNKVLECVFTDGEGNRVEPEVMYKRDYYQMRIESSKTAIHELEQFIEAMDVADEMIGE
jgi:hypothetical protein